MVNKILIRTSDRKTLHKDRRSLGMSGENLQEVLLFCLDERIEGTGIVEVELPDGEKGMIEVDRTEEGYELPVKSSLLTQTGFVKFQLRILHDNEEIFKSEIIPLEVKDSINATATIPEEYPSWVDTLTNLKKDLEKAESERVSNEEERQTAEEARQENFTEMQKTVKSAVSNIKDLKEDYNTNAKKKTDEFNNNFEEKQKAINDNAEAKTTAFGENAEAQTKTFNTNSDDKLAEYNRNHTAKIKEYDDNSKAKLDAYNKNDTDKINAYNANDIAKTKAYNDNTVLKEKAYNNNASNKTETFNSNAADKQNEFDENASDKLSEYNQNAKELINKVEQVQAENETLKAENKLIKEQIPSASASGNSVHIEDSGTLDFDWKIKGRHKQATREGYNKIDLSSILTEVAGIKASYDKETGYITFNGTSTQGYPAFYEKDINELLNDGDTWTVWQEKLASDTNHEIYLQVMEKELEDNSKRRWYTSGLANGNKRTFTVDKTKYTYTASLSGGTIANIGTLTNYKNRYMLYKGTDDKEYEQYGASPSPDYPSEIETVNGSVEIDVVNKNFYKASEKWFNNIGGVGLTVSERSNKECTLTTTQRAYTWFGSNQIGGSQKYRTKVKENTKYTFSIKAELLKGTAGIGLYVFFDKKLTGEHFEAKHKDYSSNITFVTPAGTNYIHFRIDIYNANTAYRISEIKIEAEDGTDKYEKHQSQTAIMPIQQEMLENDYVADVEHHEWQKFIFDGVTNRLNQKTGTSANNLYYTSYISNLLAPTSNGVKIEICSNCFKSYTANQLYGQDLVGVAVTTGKSFSIGFGLESSIDTLDKANEKLKELYDAGTPIIIYYKLAEAIDLELTSEQKAVRNQKLYTYKNISNIDVSDELASIDVEYKKNPATEHDDLQNQIDEIKQLISTTETSALLLDNLQKDVESEVE